MRILTSFGMLAVISAAFHGAWEYLHIPLYGGYEYLTDVPIVLYATMGDVGYTLIVALTFFMFRKDIFTTPRKADFIFLAAIGFFIALFVEYKAMAFGNWVYMDTMPIIPILYVGLTPVLQMTILLPLSVLLTSRIGKHAVVFFRI